MRYVLEERPEEQVSLRELADEADVSPKAPLSGPSENPSGTLRWRLFDC